MRDALGFLQPANPPDRFVPAPRNRGGDQNAGSRLAHLFRHAYAGSACPARNQGNLRNAHSPLAGARATRAGHFTERNR